MGIQFTVWKGIEVNAAEEGRFTAMASVFNVVNKNDQKFYPGSFTKTVKERGRVPVLNGHDPSVLLGYADITETDRGLMAAGKIEIETAAGRDAWVHMRSGIMSEWSIGFYVEKETNETINNRIIRAIHEVRVIEASILPNGFAANPQAQTIMLNRYMGYREPPLAGDSQSEPQTHSDISEPQQYSEAELAGILTGIQGLTDSIREVNRK